MGYAVVSAAGGACDPPIAFHRSVFLCCCRLNNVCHHLPHYVPHCDNHHPPAIMVQLSKLCAIDRDPRQLSASEMPPCTLSSAGLCTFGPLQRCKEQGTKDPHVDPSVSTTTDERLCLCRRTPQPVMVAMPKQSHLRRSMQLPNQTYSNT